MKIAGKITISKWRDLDIDAVIWTNLPEKWDTKKNDISIIKIILEKLIEFLKNLEGQERKREKECIRKTLPQIFSKFRDKIGKKLG